MTEVSLSFGYVKLDNNVGPNTGHDYPVLDATDASLSGLPIGPGCDATTGLYAVTFQVLSLWIEDLPDFGSNEVLFKLSGQTRAGEDPNLRVDTAVDFNFRVPDRNRASIDFALGFTNVLLRNRLVIGLQLIELDKDASAYYKKVKDAISPETGRQLIDVLKGVPYLELATSVADGLIEAFGKNDSDQVWSSNPVFAVRPAPGAPFLRTGIYVAYENPCDDLPPAALTYRDRRVRLADSAEQAEFKRNFLVFSLMIEPAPASVSAKLTS
ncbi:hypothetical protein JIG36_05410 [Actinoplanes sp. LDG1-06]|uniref:Uncharacterized protein n=1 Tax=Paractinoplanes ovalisporus TaxID=2810368 RepID=A0ABS2A578_9ACTN|nr:hypothetical protein [Actinoplanes ovalisporus]MBM2614995.1 hypothetical protein [Actinoplanes ovalisporus]